MLRIYHVTGTRGTRVIWLCEELGVDYEITKVEFSPEYRAREDWRAISPLGKVPLMTDGDIVMYESGAMMQYILDRYAPAKLAPAIEDEDYGPYLQWMWFAEATLCRPMGEIVNHRREFPGDKAISAVTEEMANRSVACLQVVADHLRDRDFLLGDAFSAADIMMGYAFLIADMVIADRIPAGLTSYRERLQARPAFVKARAV